MNAILQSSFHKFAAAHGFDLNQELIIDSFAGGGGASTGIEEAFRRMKLFELIDQNHRGIVDIAINHDDKAIAMHMANHPQTMHITHDIWGVDPLAVTGGMAVGAMWASPDCRDHSKAKGGRPVSASVRDLAWVVAHWAELVRPRMLFLENVEEFRDWGPLIPDGNGDMKRDPFKKGATFKRWIRRFKRMGYKIEWRELRASEFGVPTIRKRLYIIMRCDNEPIVWPEVTNGDLKDPDVIAGKLWPNEIAADCLDMDRPCPSIFMTREEARAFKKRTGIQIQRPLAFNSEARIAKGTMRYVVNAAPEDRFIVTLNHSGEEFRGQGAEEPFKTVAAARDAHGIVVPSFVSVNHGDSGGRREYGAAEPFGTVETSPSRAVVMSHLQAYYGHSAAGGNDRSASAVEPMRVVTTEPRHALISSFLVPRYGERDGQAPRSRSLLDLYPTVVPTGNGGDLCSVQLAQFMSYGQHGGRSRSALDPFHTVEASTKDTNQVVSLFLNKHNTGSVGSSMLSAAPTVTANSFKKRPGGAAPLGATAVYLVRQFGHSVGRSALAPAGTITAGGGGKTEIAAIFLAQNNTGEPGNSALRGLSTIVGKGSTQSAVAAHMLSMKGSDRRAYSAFRGVEALTAKGQHAAVAMPFLQAYYGVDQDTPVTDPLHSVTTKPRFSVAETELAAPPLTEEQLIKAKRVADFLRRHGVWNGGDLVIVGDYVIVDIGMRMLTPRELARAQGFPDSYILAAPYKGKTLTETDQRHKIGNSVCPEMATRIFMANYRPKKRVAPVPDQGWLFEERAAA